MEETLANNTSYESAIKAELEDERQNLIRVKLHNDTLENQIYDLTKQNTEVRNFNKIKLFTDSFSITVSNKNVKSSRT